jgi:3-methyladenine DNA glycosylase/8-oxoguanine DNA glycosylase
VGSRLTILPPADYALPRDVCSYGYFLLAPNRWNPTDRTLTRPLDLEGGVATVTISQRGAQDGPKRARNGAFRWACSGEPIDVVADRTLSRAEAAEAKRLIGRMLALDGDNLHEFHALDERARATGHGRLFRSPTLFEDVIKTVTSCNVAWTSTIRMNQRLCEVVRPAFPSARQMARRRPSTLRARCSVGYRDKRMVELARLFAAGEIDERWLSDPAVPDREVFDFLVGLPGLGPYSAANVMQLIGRYERLPIDTETFRHARTVLGMTGTDAQLHKRVEAHYAPFGRHKFRRYWFELWEFYEAKRGQAWTWDPETTGKTFTASALKDDSGSPKKGEDRLPGVPKSPRRKSSPRSARRA